MRKAIRWIGAVIVLFMSLPVVSSLFQINVERLSEREQWDRWLLEHWGAIVNLALCTISSQFFWAAFGTIAGVTVTLWVQEWLRSYPVARFFHIAGVNTAYNEERGAEYVATVRSELISKFWNWKEDALLMRPEYTAYKERVVPELAKWFGTPYANRWGHIGDLGPHFKEHYKLSEPEHVDEQAAHFVKDLNKVRSMMERDLHMFDDLLDKYNESRLFKSQSKQ